MKIENIIFTSLAVYAMLKWWFHTSIMDHIVQFGSFGKFLNFSELKITLSSRGIISRLIVELFECPWCLSFHLSLWLNSIYILFSQDVFILTNFVLSTLAIAGIAMFLWQSDIKN